MKYVSYMLLLLRSRYLSDRVKKSDFFPVKFVFFLIEKESNFIRFTYIIPYMTNDLSN